MGELKRVICGRDEEKLANTNPIRYHGYYYDTETGYYYLQSRYYDPSICRFINSDAIEISNLAKNMNVGTNLFAYCNNDPTNNEDISGLINFNKVFGKLSILSAVLSVIELISLVAFQHSPWGKAISLLISAASLASNIYSYTKAINSAKSYYGKNSSTYKKLLKYNSVILAANVAFIVVCYFLGKSIVKKYSLTIAYALIHARTITIIGMSINVAELLSGKSVMYRSRKR